MGVDNVRARTEQKAQTGEAESESDRQERTVNDNNDKTCKDDAENDS